MDLLSLTNRAQFHVYYKKVKERKLLSFKPQFCNSVIYYRGISLQQTQNFNTVSPVSKLCQQGQKHKDMGCEFP